MIDLKKKQKYLYLKIIASEYKINIKFISIFISISKKNR